MSVMCCVYVREGIVLAADSRLMIAKSQQRNVVYTLSDNAQKVLWLKNHNTGIVFCGNALQNGMIMSDYMSIFEKKHLDPLDTPKTIANKIANLSILKGTHFFVCGFENGLPFAYDVKYQKSTRLNASGVGNSNVKYGVTWSGQKAAITKIIKGEPSLNINWDLMPLKDAIEFAEFLIHTTIQYERFNDGLQTCGGSIDVLVLTPHKIFWDQHKIHKVK